MSMTRKEVIAEIEKMSKLGSYTRREALKVALSALRPVSWEWVEKVWRGKWVPVEDNAFYNRCSKCGKIAIGEHSFCRNCGAPMTDEAVDILLKRLEVLHNE